MRHTGPLYRALNPYWSWGPVSGEGARINGGRFNKIGMSALYLSEDPLTTIMEASPLGLPMEPLTICQYDVDCDPIFDATNSANLTKLGISFQQLECPNWMGEMLSGTIPESQMVADHLVSQGFVGIRVQSFAKQATSSNINVVLWNWSDVVPTKVRVVDNDGRLPTPPK